MPTFRVSGLPSELSEEVRRTRRSPEFGHPVIAETAQGTGPCRSCLSLFDVGKEERLLFTYAPPSGEGTRPAPGPVFIHAEDCQRYDASVFPQSLTALPLLIEGRTADGRVPRSVATNGDRVDSIIEDLLNDANVDFLFVRHGEAGCHIARIDRARLLMPENTTVCLGS